MSDEYSVVAPKEVGPKLLCGISEEWSGNDFNNKLKKQNQFEFQKELKFY